MAGKIRLIGAVGIKVRPDTSEFKKELREQVGNLPDYDIEVNVDADTTIAKRKMDKLRDEEEKKTLKLRLDDSVYDDIKNAQSAVKRAISDLNRETITVKLNDKELNDKLNELTRKARGATVKMEYNDDKAGYEAILAKIKAIQREKAVKEITFKTDNKSLAAEARKYEKLLDELAPSKTITITHRNDNASLRAAVKQIDDALASLKDVTITPEMSEAELLKQRDKLQGKLEKTPLELKINNDKKGYEEALAHVEKLQRELTKTTLLRFKTDEAGLEREAAKIKKKIAELTPAETVLKKTIEFSYDNDLLGVNGALDEVTKKLKELSRVKITADLDEAGLLEAKRKLEDLQKNAKLEITVDSRDVSALEAQRKKVQELLDKQNAKNVMLTVENNQESLEEAKRQLDDLIKDRKAEINAEALTWEAAMQLSYASRARDVPFYVRVNQRSVAIAEGIFKSLAGINVLQSSGRMLESLVTNFDKITLKTGAIGAGLASIVDMVAYLATATLSIGEGMLNVVGMLAMAPAALAAITAVTLINIAAWKDFKSAIDGNKEAMAGLPPEAQKTAKALQGVWKSIQEPVQNNFWKGMGDSMATSFQAFVPIVREGLAGAALHVGQFTAGVFRSFEKLAVSGDMQKMFGYLEEMFDNASGAAEPLFDAINRIGLRGSEYLPQFGQWLTDISIRFDNWIKKADEAGKINVWIEQGVASLRNMWSLGGGIIKMFQGLTRAAKEAGTGGLRDVADEFNRIGDMMLREPFQRRMGIIFDGARDGASKLNAGVKDLGETLGEAAGWTGNLLEEFGALAGVSLSGIATALSNTTFQSGTLSATRDLRAMVDGLDVAFYDAGETVGNLATIAGAAFESIGPVISQVIGLVESVVATLATPISNTIPGLMDLVGGLVSSLTGPVEVVAEMLANILNFINGLPGPLSGVMISMVGFLLLAGRIGPMFANPKSGGLLEKIKYDFQQADGARDKFATGMKGMGAGLLSAVGGPWGLAVGLVTTGLAVMGQNAADAKADVDAHTAALDANTGAYTRNNAAIVAKKIVDAEGQAGVKTASEIIKTLGLSVEETAAIVAEGGPKYDALIGKLKEGSAAAQEMSVRTDDSGRVISGNRDAWDQWTNSLGIASDAQGVNGLALDATIGLLEGQRGAADKAAGGWSLMNDALEVGDQRTRDFNTAMQAYNDTTGTADSRTRALKDALDLLSGKQPSLEEATLKVNDAMRSAAGTMSTVDGKAKLVGGAFRDAQGNLLNFNGVINKTTGEINTAGDAGAGLYRNLQSVTDNVLGTATAMKDAKAPTQDIAKYLATARDQYIQMGVQAGLNKDVVAAAYDHMIGANPKDLLTTITAQGVQEAEDKIRNYQGTLEEVDAYRAVAEIAGDDAILGVKLADAYTDLGAWDKALGTATAGLDPKPAQAVKLRLTQELIALAKTDPTVRALMDPRILEDRRREILDKLAHLGRQKPSPVVTAQTVSAQQELRAVQGLLDGLRDKEVSVTTRYKSVGDANRAGMPIPGAANGAFFPSVGKGWNPYAGTFAMAPQFFANGGFSFPHVKQFANGGIENHVAQIARPQSGTVRIWGEEETGGEAYIPLSMQKRGRSTQILNQVAKQFGYSLTKVNAYADGGVVGAGSRERSGSATVNIDSYIQQSHNTADDVARAIMRRVKSRGVYAPLEGF
jgi:hypothetical protein